VFDRSAAWYDALYAWKDYGAESARLWELLRAGGQTGGTLLEVACGTGNHLVHLRHHYSVEGLDLDAGLLERAREKVPEVPLHLGDMRAFDLGRQFDVVTCLFSSIGYTRERSGLRRAIACMARHLAPKGLLVVEPWFPPDRWHRGRMHLLTTDQPDLKVARMSRADLVEGAENPVSILDFQYLVGTPAGVDHLVERHELGLFTRDQMDEAFDAAALKAEYDDQGLSGRGLYTGRR
jgi:SAM-dependent methyltransferase